MWPIAVYFRRMTYETSVIPGTSGAARVLRGGSWNNWARNCRAAYRNANDPANDWNDTGLRLSAAHMRRRSSASDPVPGLLADILSAVLSPCELVAAPAGSVERSQGLFVAFYVLNAGIVGFGRIGVFRQTFVRIESWARWLSGLYRR